MARLPVLGADENNWGFYLNEFLQVSHHADGALRGVPEVVNVRDFGALGNGSADDTQAVQAAINAAASGSVIYFPPGTYSVSGTGTEMLLVPKVLHFRGAGAHACFIQAAAGQTDPNIDIMRIDVQCKSNVPVCEARFMTIEGLRISPAGRCRHTINIDVNDTDPLQVQANLLIQDCFLISSGNGYAIYLTNSHPDGFFASHINRNFILGGICLNNSGDSIWITHNLISDQPAPAATGTNTGITLNNDKGAVSSVIAYNNISAYGGAINIIRGGETKILYNQLEARPEYHKGIHDALLSIEGDMKAQDQCSQIDIVGNNINPNQTVEYAIYLGYASETVIENNLLVSGKPGADEKQRHIKMESYTKDTRIGFNTWVDVQYKRVEPRIEGANDSTVHMYTLEGALELRSKSLRLSNTDVGFFGAEPVSRQVIEGARGGNAALASLISALEKLGLVIDKTEV